MFNIELFEELAQKHISPIAVQDRDTMYHVLNHDQFQELGENFRIPPVGSFGIRRGKNPDLPIFQSHPTVDEVVITDADSLLKESPLREIDALGRLAHEMAEGGQIKPSPKQIELATKIGTVVTRIPGYQRLLVAPKSLNKHLIATVIDNAVIMKAAGDFALDGKKSALAIHQNLYTKDGDGTSDGDRLANIMAIHNLTLSGKTE